jgi:hypothetical protein
MPHFKKLSKAAQRRVRNAKGLRVFARKNGKAGWKIRVVARGYDPKPLIKRGYRRVRGIPE